MSFSVSAGSLFEMQYGQYLKKVCPSHHILMFYRNLNETSGGCKWQLVQILRAIKGFYNNGFLYSLYFFKSILKRRCKAEYSNQEWTALKLLLADSKSLSKMIQKQIEIFLQLNFLTLKFFVIGNLEMCLIWKSSLLSSSFWSKAIQLLS